MLYDLYVALVTFSLAFHSSLELLEVPEFDLEFLHLRLDKQRYERLDLAFLYASQMLGLHRGRCQGCRRCRLQLCIYRRWRFYMTKITN